MSSKSINFSGSPSTNGISGTRNAALLHTASQASRILDDLSLVLLIACAAALVSLEETARVASQPSLIASLVPRTNECGKRRLPSLRPCLAFGLCFPPARILQSASSNHSWSHALLLYAIASSKVGRHAGCFGPIGRTSAWVPVCLTQDQNRSRGTRATRGTHGLGAGQGSSGNQVTAFLKRTSTCGNGPASKTGPFQRGILTNGCQHAGEGVSQRSSSDLVQLPALGYAPGT